MSDLFGKKKVPPSDDLFRGRESFQSELARIAEEAMGRSPRAEGGILSDRAFADAWLAAARKGDNQGMGRLLDAQVRCRSCDAVSKAEAAFLAEVSILACPNCGEIWWLSDESGRTVFAKALKVEFPYTGGATFASAAAEESFARGLLDRWLQAATRRLDRELGPNWCFDMARVAVLDPMTLGVELTLRDEAAEAVPRIKEVLKQEFERAAAG